MRIAFSHPGMSDESDGRRVIARKTAATDSVFTTERITSSFGVGKELASFLSVNMVSDSDFTVSFNDLDDALAAIEKAKQRSWMEYLASGGNPRNKRSHGVIYASIKRAVLKAAGGDLNAVESSLDYFTAAISPDARKAYNAGWKAGQNASPEAVERADRRRAPREWYMGFFDAEGGLEKYHSLSLDDSE